MPTIHIAIGNSDGKLSQRDWISYWREVDQWVDRAAKTVYGRWFSAPDSEFQNACWAFEPVWNSDLASLEWRRQLSAFAYDWSQDSIAWNESEAQFIEARDPR